MMIVIAVGVVGTTGAFVLGPFVIEKFYDAELSGRTLAMLALSSACYMLALATAQAVIALRGHALVALGWAIGFVTFIFTTWVAGDQLFRRIEIALVASSIASMIAFGLALRSKLAAGVVPTGASVMDAITTQPLET
jgi:O-antigen/teichoic acid export membrane protein